MDPLISKIETAINRVVALDKEFARALSEIQDKTIAVEFMNTGQRVSLTVVEHGLVLSSAEEVTADVTIRGTPLQLLSFVRAMQDRKNKGSGSIEIIGDVALAQDFQNIMKNMDIDWEEYLSQWIGDTPARKLGNFIRNSAHFIKGAARSIEMDVSEYLRYEKPVLVDQTEVDEFNSAVDTLRNDVERLRFRINQL